MKASPAFVALLVVLAAFCGSIVLRGRVIYPHDNRAELGIGAPDAGHWPSNHKFDDESSFYVPEIDHHLHGDRTGWLSTWNPHNELGRPSSQVSGFSPAFVLTRFLSWFTRDALVLYTALTLVTLVLTGLFAFLLLSALDLHPWACLAGAVGLALSCFAVYWLTFVMFLAGLCWTLAIAWLVVRFLERPTFPRGLGIAFCVQALLLSAYPQQIVWHGYLLAAFAIARWIGSGRGARRMLALAACVAFGFALASPVYVDLALTASRSARVGTDPEFFLKALPRMQGLHDAGVLFGQLFDAWWTGNPIREEYAARFNGVCLTPFYAGLVLVSWMEGEWKRTRLWLGFAGMCFALALQRDAFLFAVRHLGLGFSVFSPLAAALIPLAVASTCALDRVLRTGFRRPWIAVACASIAPLCALSYLLAEPSASEPANVAIGLAVFVGFAALVITRKVWIVPLLVVVSVLHYGSSLVLARPESTIARTSPLVETLRELTRDGEHFAIVGSGAPLLLPPNQEAWLGLHSIHAYDSLSSRAYQSWCLRVSAQGARMHGRYFERITDATKLASDEMSWSGIGVLLSFGPIAMPGATPDVARGFDEAAVLGPFHLYKKRHAPELVAQISGLDTGGLDRSIVLEGPLEERPTLPIEVREHHDDAWLVETTPADEPTLLFFSAQYDPRWTARSDTPSAVVSVNGFYLGAIVPPHTREVRLEFRPWARWMWLSQAVLGLGGLVALGLVLRARLVAPRDPR